MTRTVLAITADATLDVAQAMMRDARIHHLVVMKAGRVAGVLSSRDVDRVQATHYASRSMDDVWIVDESMSVPVVVGSPEMTVRDAANLLRGHSIGCLPIVDGKELVGIVTTSDLLELLASKPLPAEPIEPIENDIGDDIRINC